jgi:hypothetical protein
MNIVQIKSVLNTLLLLLITKTGWSQNKSLEELRSELFSRVDLKTTDYVILSRATSEMAFNETNETIFLDHYILFLIKKELDKVVIEEYKNGHKTTIFEIKNSNIFKLVKGNSHLLAGEKLKDFEYDKDGSKLYLKESNSGKMIIDIFYNQMSYHNEFEDFLLDFSSNSKLKLVKLIVTIEHELSPFYTHHPFYVGRN